MESDHPEIVQRLVRLAQHYDEKAADTKAREKKDGTDYSWTWNFYEGKANAYRDSAMKVLDAVREGSVA